MLTNLLTLLLNFHNPFIESFQSWYYLIVKDSTSKSIPFWTNYFWDELSMFSPSYENSIHSESFFQWYGPVDPMFDKIPK
jgi:hypothetical protein